MRKLGFFAFTALVLATSRRKIEWRVRLPRIGL